MKLIFLIALVSAVVSRPTDDKRAIIRRLQLSSRPDLFPAVVTEERYEKPSWVTSSYQAFSNLFVASRLENPFEIKVDCKTQDTGLCKKAEFAVVEAGKRIAKVLHINKPIRVNVTVDPCTDPLSGKDTCNFLALCGPGALFEAKMEGEPGWTYHSSALLKQLPLDKQPKWPEFDVNVVLNTRFNYWARSDGRPIKEDEVDIEYIAAHEMTHGLGFISSFSQIDGTPYLLPVLNPIVNEKKNKLDIYWSAPTGYDRLLFDPASGKNLTELVKPGYDDLVTDITEDFETLIPERVKAAVLKDKIVEETGERLLRLARNSLGIRFSTRDSDKPYRVDGRSLNYSLPADLQLKWGEKYNLRQLVNLQATRQSEKMAYAATYPDFQKGSSMIHFSDDYERTPNFLMTSSVSSNAGIALDEIIRMTTLDGQIKTPGVYGYELAKIMTDIGWPSVIDSTQKKMILRVDGNNALSLKLGWSILAVLVLSLV